MDIKDFKETPKFEASHQASNLMEKVNLQDPTQMVVGAHPSVPALIQNFISCQAQTSNTLIEMLGQRVDGDIVLQNKTLTAQQQKEFLNDLAGKQSLLTRQIEHSLFQHVQFQQGIESESDFHLINISPDQWGIEQKVSDSGLRLLSEFTGDSSSNEQNLNQFLRDIYALAKTGNLTQQAAIAVILRKLAGSAHILIDDFVVQQGGISKVTMTQVIGQLERKFLISCSPLHADTQLHGLQQNTLTYSQLQATVQRLSKLATRLESEEKRETLTRVKENSAFLMALSQADRLLINSENVRRASQNLVPLNLDQMSNYLIKHAADKMSYRDQHIFLAEEAPEQPVFPVYENVRQQTRGNTRGQFRGRGSGQQRQQYNRQGGNPIQDFQPNLARGNDKFRRGQYRGNRGQGANAGQRGRNMNYDSRGYKFITCEIANVTKNSCIMCGEADHHFKNEKCIYKNEPLMPSPCKKCSIGVHPTKACLANVRQKDDFWPHGRM